MKLLKEVKKSIFRMKLVKPVKRIKKNKILFFLAFFTGFTGFIFENSFSSLPSPTSDHRITCGVGPRDHPERLLGGARLEWPIGGDGKGGLAWANRAVGARRVAVETVAQRL